MKARSRSFGSFPRLDDFSPLIGRIARTLIRQARELGWNLNPADAIYLATAQQMAATWFHPLEKEKLDKYGPIFGFTVEEPQAMEPHLTTMGRTHDPNQYVPESTNRPWSAWVRGPHAPSGT